MASGGPDSTHFECTIASNQEYSCAKTDAIDASLEHGNDPRSVHSPRAKMSKSENTEDDIHLESCDRASEIRRNDKYCNFCDYDFEVDVKFQQGWAQLSSVVSREEHQKHFLRAKLFYYSKHFEPVNYEEYMVWMKIKKKGAQDPIDESATKRDNSCSSDAHGKRSPHERELDSVSLTFSELINVVQSGRDIPGLKTVEIQPTDADPSPSVLQRKAKPWES